MVLEKDATEYWTKIFDRWHLNYKLLPVDLKIGGGQPRGLDLVYLNGEDRSRAYQWYLKDDRDSWDEAVDHALWTNTTYILRGLENGVNWTVDASAFNEAALMEVYTKKLDHERYAPAPPIDNSIGTAIGQGVKAGAKMQLNGFTLAQYLSAEEKEALKGEYGTTTYWVCNTAGFTAGTCLVAAKGVQIGGTAAKMAADGLTATQIATTMGTQAIVSAGTKASAGGHHQRR